MEKIKEYLKNHGKTILKITIVASLILLIVLFGGSYITMELIVDRVNEKVTEYTRSVSISDDGTISTAKSAEELWNEMVKAGYQVEDYLDGPEDLARLMNAELVTQLPDMRANVEDPIDWEAIFNGEWMVSSQWAGDEPEYIEHMRLKMKHYGSSTDYGCMIDCDNCRLTIFHKNGDDWELVAGWNTFQGSNSPWTSYEQNGVKNEAKSNWTGPRSRSFKGAFKVVGRWADSNGLGWNNYAVCYVDGGHAGGAWGQDNCQRFEFTGYGDPDTTDKSLCYKTTGCCGLSKDHSTWIYNNIPDGTTVVVFDKYNPMPKWNEWDAKASVVAPLSKDLDYEALMAAEKKTTTTSSDNRKATRDEEKEFGTTEQTTTTEDKKATRDEIKFQDMYDNKEIPTGTTQETTSEDKKATRDEERMFGNVDTSETTSDDLLTEDEKKAISPATTSDSTTSTLFKSGTSSLQGIIKFKRYDKDGNSHYLTYANPIQFQKKVEEYNKFHTDEAREYVMSHFTLKENPKSTTSGIINGTGSFKKYTNLTDEQIRDLARVCAREQNSDQSTEDRYLAAVAAEASLMANLTDFSEYDSPYDYVTQSLWFRRPRRICFP